MSFGGQKGGAMGGQDEMAQMASMRMMFGFIKTCFNDCVVNFNSPDLAAGEKTCITNCTVRMGKSAEAMAMIQNELEAKMQGRGGF